MTYIFAKLTDTRPKELVHTIGDAHIYANHVSALHKQIGREPYPFPVLNIKDCGQKDVRDFAWEQFELRGYRHYKGIKMDMAV